MREGLTQARTRYPSTARRCSCSAKTVLLGSVSITESQCFGCRQNARRSMTAQDLERIVKEHGARSVELRKLGFHVEADDWATEAACINLELNARRADCTHDGIPFGVCSGCGLDLSTEAAPVAVDCSACGDTGFRFNLPPDAPASAEPCSNCWRGAEHVEEVGRV